MEFESARSIVMMNIFNSGSSMRYKTSLKLKRLFQRVPRTLGNESYFVISCAVFSISK